MQKPQSLKGTSSALLPKNPQRIREKLWESEEQTDKLLDSGSK